MKSSQTATRTPRVLPVTFASNSCLVSCVRCSAQLPRFSSRPMHSHNRGTQCLLFRRDDKLWSPPWARARSRITARTAEAGYDLPLDDSSFPGLKLAPRLIAVSVALMSVSGIVSASFADAGGFEAGVPPASSRASGLRGAGTTQERFYALFDSKE